MGEHDIQGHSCVVCGMPNSTARWWRMERAGCPGVRWLRVAELVTFPYLATETTLRTLKHTPGPGAVPSACYYSTAAQAYRLLYDVREAHPVRRQTDRQARL